MVDATKKLSLFARWAAGLREISCDKETCAKKFCLTESLADISKALALPVR